ncbi:protein phosphatase 1 regulatory subunit 12A-like [Clytia hemisphaerica]|uniref:Uncharacterized protein n=1 Tax=Clytia hemisphaerica TaxID=252671 RepID=A0A7M5UYI0_9CNID|eukprot:TCONS_00049867-protein
MNFATVDNRVDHANPFTNQIFQEAVIRNDKAIVKLLLKYGIYPKRNERNRQGLTALQQCVLDGNGRMAILLLEAGADIEAKTSNGWTCLHIASALGDLDMLATLVNHCCDLVALTKNEELPIDLAASRDIKIKLAKEMSRIGYSELAQWYMRKLAAREGVFYVLSADTLLDLACEDKQEGSLGSEFARQYNQQREMYIHSPIRKQDSQAFRIDASPKKDLWLENPAQEQTKYLTYSSGYLSEVVFDPASGQYLKALSSNPPLLDSPQRKTVIEEKIQLASISEVDGPPISMEESKSRSGTLKRTSSNKRHSQNLRKQSTIELHIDYSHTTESESDDDCAFVADQYDGYLTQPSDVTNSLPNRRKPNNADSHSPGHLKTYERSSFKSSDRPSLESVEEHTGLSNETLIIKDTPIRSALASSNESNNQPELTEPYSTTPPTANSTLSSSGSGGKSKNVKFNPVDKNNEFCNCPTCKKLGYAFSPDIQVGSRKPPTLQQAPQQREQASHLTGKTPQEIMQTGAGYNQFYYPETTTEKGGLYYDQSGYEYKPRKRKKKLFSGIKSMFKDSIKVRTNMDPSPACDDAGILFSVSVRDRNKAKQIRQRQEVRRSNSFSGMESSYKAARDEEVSVLSHSQVVAPPAKFSDIYQERGVFDPTQYETKMESSSRVQQGEYPHQSSSQQQYQQSQQQNQQRGRDQAPSNYYQPRNTYESSRREKHQFTRDLPPPSMNGAIADDMLYYTEEEINAYLDATTTLPHGFHYSRAPQTNNYQQHPQNILQQHPKQAVPIQQQIPPLANNSTGQQKYHRSNNQNHHQQSHSTKSQHPPTSNNHSTNYQQQSTKSSTVVDHHHQHSSSSHRERAHDSHHSHHHKDEHNNDKRLMAGKESSSSSKTAMDNCEYCKSNAPIAGAIPIQTAE